MNKRYLAAAVLITIGFLLIVGAVGSLEYGSMGVREVLFRSGLGFLLIFLAIPVSGDMKENRR